ncbi:MAG: adenylate kinase [Spirochaetota bacterium]
MNVIIMGAPGAGKGTHAKAICERFNIPHISTGDILRAEVEKDTDLGRTAKSYMDQGKLLPDDIIIEIIKNRLQDDDCKNGYLFDGFPRTLNQARGLDQISEVHAVICLKCSDEIIIKRLTGRRMTKDGKIYNIYFDPPPPGVEVYKREDDNEEAIKERLKVFYETFKPVMDFYRQKGTFYEVKGDAPKEVAQKNIMAILEKIA